MTWEEIYNPREKRLIQKYALTLDPGQQEDLMERLQYAIQDKDTDTYSKLLAKAKEGLNK